MKTKLKTGLLIAMTALLIQGSFAQEIEAIEIIKKADQLLEGESNYGEMTMKIVRPSWERSLSFKTCSKDRKYSLTLVTDPVKEKGQTFLKRQNDLWSWNPKISRLIKLPPSMLSQGWMGSDYSNDDILKESSMVVDYTHSIVGSEEIAGKDCYKIEMIPHDDAAVVWGKVVKWISKEGFMQLKSTYYDEDDYLIKTEECYDIKTMGDREIPTRIEIIPEDEPGNKTIVIINKIIYDVNVADNFFSQQNMKKGMNLRFPTK